MQLTKGAIGNLINRYKAVLKKCSLLNVFGTLAVGGVLVLGIGSSVVNADDYKIKTTGGSAATWAADNVNNQDVKRKSRFAAQTASNQKPQLRVRRGRAPRLFCRHVLCPPRTAA